MDDKNTTHGENKPSRDITSATTSVEAQASTDKPDVLQPSASLETNLPQHITNEPSPAGPIKLNALQIAALIGFVLIFCGAAIYLFVFLPTQSANSDKAKTNTLVVVDRTSNPNTTTSNTANSSSSSNSSARNNTTRAATNAANVQKVIEAFNADCERYPSTIAEFIEENSLAYCFTSARLPSNIVVTSAATPLSRTNGLTNVTYEYAGYFSAATGGRIKYWDFTTGSVSTTVIYVGSAVSSSTFNNPE